MKLRRLTFVAISTLAALAAGAPAVVAQTNVMISMQAAPAAPHIGGAPVVGVLTATPFLHTIAVTGTRPTRPSPSPGPRWA